jgi:hypothetical protein
MIMSSVTPLRSDAAMALSDGALPNHARLPIIAQSPCPVGRFEPMADDSIKIEFLHALRRSSDSARRMRIVRSMALPHARLQQFSELMDGS